jgi:hypothetical protein
MHGIDIRLGIDGDGFHPQLPAGADDAEGDFAAVGYEYAFEHGKISISAWRPGIGSFAWHMWRRFPAVGDDRAGVI